MKIKNLLKKYLCT